MFSDIINNLLARRFEHEESLSCSAKFLDGFITKSRIVELVPKFSMSGGKFLRSIVYFCFSEICGNFRSVREVYRDVIYGTPALIEAVHFSSILHDDIVDNNTTRRGADSFFKVCGSKRGLIMGDYIIACAASEFLRIHNNKFVRNMFIRECAATAYGALLERNLTANSSISECIRVASLKTAPFFKMAAFLGVYLSSDDFEKAKRAAIFGICFGVLYQIQNDIDCYRLTNFSESEDYMQKNVTFPTVIMKGFFDYDVFDAQGADDAQYKRAQDIINSPRFKEISLQILDKYHQQVLTSLHEFL